MMHASFRESAGATTIQKGPLFCPFKSVQRASRCRLPSGRKNPFAIFKVSNLGLEYADPPTRLPYTLGRPRKKNETINITIKITNRT
jgi:hypothetical protein